MNHLKCTSRHIFYRMIEITLAETGLIEQILTRLGMLSPTVKSCEKKKYGDLVESPKLAFFLLLVVMGVCFVSITNRRCSNARDKNL